MLIIDVARSEATHRSAETDRRNEVLRAQAERRADAQPGAIANRVPRSAHRFGWPVFTPSAP